MISFEKVTKKYGRRKILDDISFQIKPGELVTIIGASGTGKSTLMHLLIGSEKPSSGRIQVDNIAVHKLSASEIQTYRRRIGIVFQDYKLLPQKTVFENISFALEVCGYDKDTISQRTRDVLKLTGIEHVRNNFPSQISGGEKQRTAIARALVHAPELLIADEATGNLDKENTVALAKLFRTINKSGTTVIITTHDQDLISSLKARTITLDSGKIKSDK